MMRGANIGSGQRRFESTPEIDWVNVDYVSRPGQVPDVLADARSLQTLPPAEFDFVVLHHTLEHFVLPDQVRVVNSCYRIMKAGGSIIVTLPNIRALAQQWLMGKIDDYIYTVNLMGAYQGEDGDCHRWHLTQAGLEQLLRYGGSIPFEGWREIKPFDHRPIPGSSICRDWWMYSTEAVKA